MIHIYNTYIYIYMYIYSFILEKGNLLLVVDCDPRYGWYPRIC